MYIIDFH